MKQEVRARGTKGIVRHEAWIRHASVPGSAGIRAGDLFGFATRACQPHCCGSEARGQAASPKRPFQLREKPFDAVGQANNFPGAHDQDGLLGVVDNLPGDVPHDIGLEGAASRG